MFRLSKRNDETLSTREQESQIFDSSASKDTKGEDEDKLGSEELITETTTL